METDAKPDAHTPTDASAPETGSARPMGTVHDVVYADACPSSFGPATGTQLGDGGANPNYRCVTMTVSCPGIVDMTATVALSGEPPGMTPRGLIVTHDGGDGTTFFGGPLPAAWFDDGFDVAQVAWPTPWECPRGSASSAPTTCTPDTTPLASRPGLIDASCRPATVFAWIHDAAELPGGASLQPKGKAFCGFGFSAGSGALWYSLLHYGLSADFDYAGVTASTPYGRIDIGCNPANAKTMIATPCANLATDPQVPEQYDSNESTHASLINDWSSTTSCDGDPSKDELDYWQRTSIVSPGATYDIPTPVTSYDCIDPSNVDVVPGMNAYVFAELQKVDPKGARFVPKCVLGEGEGGACSGEIALDDAGMLQETAVLDMENNCVPIAR
jgi:hypothetical protein